MGTMRLLRTHTNGRRGVDRDMPFLRVEKSGIQFYAPQKQETALGVYLGGLALVLMGSKRVIVV